MWIEMTVTLSAALLTYLLREYARHKSLVDIPNERSSHTVPTPHGGGVAVIGTFFGALTWLYFSGTVETPLFLALLCALPVAVISFVDDIHPLSARVRFMMQVSCAAAAVIALGGIDRMDFGWFFLEGVWLNIVAVVTVVWMTNLYNFIDGIDGYAGSQALFVGAAAYLLFGNETALLIAAASLGFLFFNWHKASIFMGDVGSAPLGFIFAVFALYDAGDTTFLGWIVLLSLFWFDATATLLRRFRNGESLSTAHRKHMYQRLTLAGFSHDRVVMMGMGMNLLLFVLLWIGGERYYGWVFLLTLLLQYSAMKYVDSKKAFE